MIKLKITDKKEKPFIGDEGDEINYFWYTGVREDDGVSIKFGSMNPDYQVNETVDVNLEKTEKIKEKNGKKITIFVYKENAFKV